MSLFSLILKRRRDKFVLILLIISAFCTTESLVAQDNGTPMPSDSIKTVVPKKGSFNSTTKYAANDSIGYDVINQIVKLWGGVQDGEPGAYVQYEDKTLKAAYIEINWATKLVKARGIMDSTSGQMIGKPIFMDGEDVFRMDSIIYNLETDRSIVYGISYDIARDQHITTTKAYKNEDGELFIAGGKFCPCEDPTASTYIKANKIKVVPGKRVVTGPFQLWIADLPTPLFGPFGLFPLGQKKTSGLIIPTYGESVDRGFFLRNGGYYLAINPYMDLRLLGEIYTKGGWGTNTLYNYKNRYRFSGNVNLRYNKRVNNADEGPNRNVQNDFWFSWLHRPVVRRGKSFSAQVQGGSQTFNSNNSYNPQDYLSTSFNSNISYSSPLLKKANYAIKLRHSQNTQTGVVNFTLPEGNLSVNRLYPFKRIGGKSIFADLLKSLNGSYRFDTRNEISTLPPSSSFPFAVANSNIFPTDTLEVKPDNFRELLDRARFGMKHTIPISASFAIGDLKINPSFNYTELWYLEKYDYSFSQQDSAVNVGINEGLNRAAFYSTSVSMNTRKYVLYKMAGKRQLKIRQMSLPSIGFVYTPDFSEKSKFYQDVQTDIDGEVERVSRYNGFIYGSPTVGEQKRLTFSIQNSFEYKKNRKPTDTTTTEPKPKTLLQNLNVSSSYNFAADSLKLAVFNTSARTRLWKDNIDINVGATFDPYIYDSVGTSQRRVDRFAIAEGQGLAKLTSARIALGTSISPSKFRRMAPQEGIPNRDDDGLAVFEEIRNNPASYIDWSIPWSLSLNYNFNYSKLGFAEKSVTQSVSFNGDLSLTQKWKVGFTSGFDFVNKMMTYTSVNIYRDLNCWEMRFTWIPFGVRQSYLFNINIKSQLLKDLKLSRRREWYDR